MKYQKIAFVFPGQGSQYAGMGKSFAESYPIAKQTFEEADDLLGRGLSKIIFNGADQDLLETRNSQTAIYVTSIALWRVLQKEFPDLQPEVCAGHSLGEYSAITASGRAVFKDVLPLVQARGQYMNEACEATKGGMAAILGLDGDAVEALIQSIGLPNDLWAANFNSPGQVVVSGTEKGLEAVAAAAKAAGAKRVIPLTVHGAFHSGLMRQAEERLSEHLKHLPMQESSIQLVMNVLGGYVDDLEGVRRNMIRQITSPVRWEQGVRAMASQGIEFFVEIGGGKVLTGLGKRIGVEGAAIDQVEDLHKFEKEVIAEARA